jgi:HAMP domain-containing protein
MSTVPLMNLAQLALALTNLCLLFVLARRLRRLNRIEERLMNTLDRRP